MRISLELIIITIVVLITALVVITLFSSGINKASTLTSARGTCIQQAASACKSMNTLPPTWDVPTYNVELQGGVKQLLSCKEIIERENINCKCENNEFKCI